MAEEVRQILAGARAIYEVVRSDDGQTITIRLAENHEDKIELMSSVVGTLIGVLREFA
jgi:hypothetical protein